MGIAGLQRYGYGMAKCERTKRAWLPNDSLGRATPHVFHGTERVRVSCGDDGSPTALALLYRCEETGLVRRWGLEPDSVQGLWVGGFWPPTGVN
jgi:hypothetical protein